MSIRSDMVLPATKVRFELTKIIPLIRGSHYFTLTYKGYPKAALVDLAYLEKLERWYKFEKIFSEGSRAFVKYLKKEGKDINTISEQEADEIIKNLAGID